MATKKFAYRTEEICAELGDGIKLYFQPTPDGIETLASYAEFEEAREKAAKLEKDEESSKAEKTQASVELMRKLRALLSSMMTLESREQFASLSMPIPLLSELVQWVTEEQSGKDGGSQNGSVSPASKASKASTTGVSATDSTSTEDDEEEEEYSSEDF
ncbi:hypothetical protein [Phytoactinopolyspora mesophila]|uniref:Uncharacterized protein n=1 Tax=Phytoactinopolyspora mesophila TaxID=2650750 RepID=A0A7K3M6W0_9ACTN|nr:hypothetical protein [Phytoactinopolyspora mesophila]NDL58642.1 hypothetical protein [Phytoactinopolyspora mesophila]